MSASVDMLTAISSASDSVSFTVPLVYVKNKTILTLNSSNRMQFHQRMQIKNKYKEIIEPIIDTVDRFDSGHIHLVLQFVFSDRRSRDMDNQIFCLKWVQDCLVERGKLDDDKYVSFTFLPAKNEPINKEHYCEVTAIDLNKNKLFERVNNEKQIVK